jgi:hypothetical protein
MLKELIHASLPGKVSGSFTSVRADRARTVRCVIQKSGCRP